jgi:plastocyanin
MTPQTDETEQRKRGWLEWLAIGEGLTALLAIMALIFSIVAIADSQPSRGSVNVTPAAATSGSMAGMRGMAAGATTTAAAGQPVAVSMSMKSDTEHGRKGPDGKWHDAAVPASFAVHPGDQVTLTVENYDSSPHTFTSPALGAATIVPAGSQSNPSVTKVTFTAPSKPGRYLWYCNLPCDPFAMVTIGYMRGYVTVAA